MFSFIEDRESGHYGSPRVKVRSSSHKGKKVVNLLIPKDDSEITIDPNTDATWDGVDDDLKTLLLGFLYKEKKSVLKIIDDIDKHKIVDTTELENKADKFVKDIEKRFGNIKRYKLPKRS